ncbi:aspartyl protease family protein [Rhodanobacter hydrolyticus]|uniref:Aspartyl protease family protein n=2 Tax=Rhodanobacter hydrolyticus TaxID=2250595 RepID=A0ABW8JEM8_9GAMM
MAMLLQGRAFAGTCQVADYGALPVEMVGNRATTEVSINGQNTRLFLDTGAWFNTMSRANAADLKLRTSMLPFGMRGSGIGGTFSEELARIKDFSMLGATLHNVEFLVGGSDTGSGLIGANFLDVVDLDIDLAHGKLHLMKPNGCGAMAMAYWVTDGNFRMADLLPSRNERDRRSFVNVVINGKKIRALLDSGAETTMMTREAAERVGIDLSAPDVKASGHMSGLGAKTFQSWLVPIDSYSIGTETISHSKVLVMDGNIGFGNDAPDMLLGVDFFLAHHIYVANSQGRIYFTYNGGRVFSLGQAPSGTDTIAASAADAPKTADDYALRGQAYLSRGETAAALDDLNKAISMGPAKADWYATRGRVHLAMKQSDAAMDDLDQAIRLDPNDVGNLLQRARLKLARKDKAGAESDVAAAQNLAQPGSQQSRVIAQFYYTTGQPAEALPLLDEWIRLHGNDHGLGVALNERCRARALANVLPDKALKDCRKAISLDGATPAYLESEGLAQLRMQDYADAITSFQQVVSQQPHWAWARYGLGLARIRSGQPDAGNADLAAAKAINPQIAAKFEKYGI